jgi:hypothetical protein
MSAACADTVQPAAINAAAPQAILLIFNSPVRNCRDRRFAVQNANSDGYGIPFLTDKIYREF